MDGRRRRFSESKESEHGVNYSSGRYGQRERNRRYRRHQNGNSRVIESRACDYPSTSRVQPVQQASTSSTTVENETKDIPGYIYDPVKKRYFKEKDGLHKHFIVQNEIEKQDTTRKPSSKILSRLQYLRKRETTVSYNNFTRSGLEDWARTIVERQSFILSDTHPCPAFKGSLSSLALSRCCGKLVTIAKLPGLGCNTIHIYDVNYDKKFICPRMLATIIASEVTHVEWNPHESMKNYFLLNLFGSENAKGSAVVCKFDESLQSCELNSYPLPSGTAWQCSWCRNPQYSSFLGIAGTKQAVLVDSEKKAMVCKIRSSSDIFCIEFGQRSPVAYLGCRNGNIMCVDIRVRDEKQNKPFNVSGGVRSSATCVKVVEDENYLMASSIDGLIKMWDVRLSKPVKEFLGNVNETRLIPFVMDSSESILASAGHDGKTRLWSIRTCEMLKTIDETKNRNGEVNIPPVCLGENWALRDNMMAFGLGIEDKLKIYF